MNNALHAFADAAPPANHLQHWYALLDHIPIGVYICDREGTVTRFNRHAAALWADDGAGGIGQQSARGHHPPPAYDTTGLPLTPEDSPLGRALRTGLPQQGRELLLERADGTRIAVLASAEPLFDDGGQLLGAVNCIQDITAQKAAEAAARRQLQELLEALPAAVYTTDAEGTVTFFNQACVTMAGRTPRVGKDKWCVSWKLYRPDGTPLAHAECPMAVALHENRPVRGDEIVVERPDGARMPVIPYPTPIRDASGKLVAAINMLVDVSERKQAEYRQRILLDELNHRVKNNLQMLHALLRAAERESQNREARGVLKDASHRVGAIAAAQRVLYSAESTGCFDTGEFLQAVCQAAQQAFANGIKITVQANAGYLSNEISMPLALILNELLTNAVKHGLNGRRHGTVRVQFVHDGQHYRLAVEDDGAGFELKPSARRSSGLGLVIGLARQIGGTFDVERAGSTRCVVSFPERGMSVH